ncbi:MAG: DUF3316 domain-containing protein [Clostridiales bacterium]|nr:DUF3316 domain-containing protein [Clostridiales bacterium]
MIKKILTGVLVSASTLTALAGDDATPYDMTAPERPVLSAWTLGAGSSHLCDTYLSPLKYEGWTTSIEYERMQAAPWQQGRWTMQLKVGVELDHTENPARNATMWAGMLHASWGTMRRWNIPYGFTVGVGPSLSLEGGCLYNARNSNNPASAKGAVTVDATAYVARSFSLGKLPVTLRYQPVIPVAGAFFSPCYDELYYEIYLGNHSGLVHGAWWGNRFKIDNLVTADFQFGATALRLGYECRWMNSKVDHLTTRMISHRLVIGVAVNWVSRKNSKKDISPLL